MSSLLKTFLLLVVVIEATSTSSTSVCMHNTLWSVSPAVTASPAGRTFWKASSSACACGWWPSCPAPATWWSSWAALSCVRTTRSTHSSSRTSAWPTCWWASTCWSSAPRTWSSAASTSCATRSGETVGNVMSAGSSALWARRCRCWLSSSSPSTATSASPIHSPSGSEGWRLRTASCWARGLCACCWPYFLFWGWIISGRRSTGTTECASLYTCTSLGPRAGNTRPSCSWESIWYPSPSSPTPTQPCSGPSTSQPSLYGHRGKVESGAWSSGSSSSSSQTSCVGYQSSSSKSSLWQVRVYISCNWIFSSL